MSEGQCRVAVHNDGRTVDLVLPSTVDVAELLPAIVDLVRDGDAAAEGRWLLHRSGSPPLDESLTLRQNRVQDGELLWLTTDRPPPLRWTQRDACRVLANATPGGDVPSYIWVVVSMLAATAGAGALVRFSDTNGPISWVIGTGLGVLGLAAAVTARRAAHASISRTCGLIAVLYAAVSGAIALPDAPITAHLLLASAAACSVSVLLRRLALCGSTASTALITLTLLVVAVSMAGVTWDLHVATVGAALAALSLAMLGAAPRLAIAIARIEPDAGDIADVDEGRATLAHTTLSGLVCGGAAAAVAGAALVAHGRGPSSAVSAVSFTAVVGVALMLQGRTHTDPVRRGALIMSGSLCETTAFISTVQAAPQAAGWLAVAAAVTAVVVLAPVLGAVVGPFAHRAADLTEYVARVAVIPLACWVGGLYGLVRDLALL